MRAPKKKLVYLDGAWITVPELGKMVGWGRDKVDKYLNSGMTPEKIVANAKRRKDDPQ